MLLSLAATGQTSAYQCLPSENPISPNLNITPSVFIQSCMEFTGGPYLYQQAEDLHLEAVNYILMEPGFQAGEMQPNGSMLMQLAQQPAGYDVFLMSGTSTVGLPRYKKVEFGVQLADALTDRIEAFVHPDPSNTATPLNPYLESKLDVQMIFTHESGAQRKVDAFYFQDFEQNTSTNDWDELPTDHPMRVRFAPHLNGRWGVRTSVSVEGGLVANLLPFSFEVVESGHPGFVKVHQNNRNLERDNRIIFPVGHNFPSPYNDEIVWGLNSGQSNKAAKVEDWNYFHQGVVDYAVKGGKYIRTLQSAYSSLIEFENLGDYTNRLHYAWEQDRLLETCETYDLLMQFNMMQQEPLMKYANFGMSQWDFGPWDNAGVINPGNTLPNYCYYTYPGKEPMEMFTDPVDIEFHKQRTRYYISRYGYSTQIYEWELVNEPFHLGEVWHNGGSNDNGAVVSSATKYAIRNYHKEIAEYIKNDLGHVNQLVGYNMRFSDIPIGTATFTNVDDIPTFPEIDIIGYNPYTDIPDNLIISKTGNNNLEIDSGENSFYARNALFHQYVQKPVMLSETGHVGSNSCTNYVGHYKDVMTFGFSGVAGFNMWSGWPNNTPGYTEKTFLHGSTIRAQNHMNGNDVVSTLGNNSGQWRQGREYRDGEYSWDKKIKEHQFYVSNDQNNGVGYVYNRTHNLYTNLNPANCDTNNYFGPFTHAIFNFPQTVEWNKKTMKVHGLKKSTWYTIDFYSYKDGIYLSSECVKSNFKGELKLKHPIMEHSGNPLLWYVIKSSECNGKMDLEGLSENLEPLSESSLALHISPNPNSGTFSLQIEAEEGRELSLQIFNLFGQEVYAMDQIREEQLTLDTGLPSGMYLIKLSDGQNEQTQKFIVD